MALTFPTYFPKTFLGPVVKAAANAEREIRAGVKAVPLGDTAAARRAATRYITAVAFTFAHQACEAARAGDPHVAVSRVAWYVEDFIRRLSAHLYHELADPGSSRRWGPWEGFEREMRLAVLDSDRWAEHLAERAAVANDASDVSSRKTDVQVPSALAAESPAAEASSSLVSLATAADHLGIHEDTIRRMAERGDIRIVRIGKRLQVPQTELSRLCETGEYPPKGRR